MDLTLGNGYPIYFMIYEIATKEVQSNCGVIYDNTNMLDNSSAPTADDGITPIFRKVTSTSKQKILDYVTENNLVDTNNYLSLLDI